MAGRPVGSAEIEIRPGLSTFEAQLRSQLQPIVARVESQLGPAFARAGQAAGELFSRNFARTVGTQIGTAIQGAAGGRGVVDAGKQVAAQIGQGLQAEAPTQISKGLQAGVQKATTSSAAQLRGAGEQSGRVFGSGFGEGFAALAAFAIASRIGRFFRQTVAEAGEFADAMAGVRKNVEGTPEQFASLESRVKGLAESLGIAAPELAGIAEEAGKFGVPVANLESFTETAAKLGIALDVSAREAASGLAVFARLTDTPFTQVSNLGSALAELDAQFAGTAPRILEFATRAAAGLNRLGFTAPQILAVGAAFQEAGVRTDSGSRAVIAAVTAIQRAAAGTGPGLEALVKITRLAEDEFKSLAASDPGALFVRFLQGVSTAGAELTPVLKEVGLDADRLSQNLGVGAAQFSRLATGISEATKAAEENTRVDRELASRQESSADRLRRVEEAFRNTRIEIGSKLSPALLSILKPLSQLSTGTVGVVAAFAGLAAAGFAVTRFSNILREFSKTLGGGALSAKELGVGLQIAQAQTTSLSSVLRIAKTEKESLIGVQTKLAAGNADLTAKFAANRAETLGLVGAYRAVKTASDDMAAAQLRAIQATQAQTQFLNAQKIVAGQFGAATRVVTDSVITNTRAALVQAEANNIAATSMLGTARAAFTAAGGFGALLTAMGKIAIVLTLVDFFTQAERAALKFLDTMIRGEADIDGTTNALLRLFAGTASVDEVLEKSRVSFDSWRDEASGAASRIGNAVATGPTAAINFLARTIEDTGIPGLEQLGGAVGTVTSTATDLINRVPFLGRVITTEGERATRQFEDLNASLLKLFEQSPAAARAVFETLSDALQRQGVDQDDINKGLGEFVKKSKDATEGQRILAENADAIIQSLREQGLSEEEVAREAQKMGLSMEALGGDLLGVAGASETATAAFNRITQAQADFTSRVQSLIQPVSGLIAAQKALGKSGSGAARDNLRSARAIADAERALAEAREDAARRIADAQRKLSEAEVDAARRIIDAQRRLEESRIQSRRSLRDAGEALNDFEEALERVGGALTPEDVIRLRDLQQAVADATEDAANREIEGRRNVEEAQVEGAERVAESRRKLAETEEEAAERIEEALLRLARAHEDAGARQSAAAAKTAEAIVLSVAQITKGFRDQANQLNTFTTLMSTVADRVFNIFSSRDLGEAFLADLNEMGVEAIPILRNLVNASDTQLKGLGTAFEDQIKAAKKAADFQFKRFPPNFKQAIAPAINNIIIELERGISAFDGLEDKSGDIAAAIGTDIQNLVVEFSKLATEAGGSLNPVVTDMLDLANSAGDSSERVRILKDLIAGIRGGKIPLTVDFSADTRRLEKQFAEAVKRMIAKDLETGGLFGSKYGSTIMGPLARLPRAQFGATFPTGTPLLVGKHTAQELFIPSTAGAIFKHTDTERILRALRAPRQQVTQQSITVNEVADSPEATARTISFLLGSNGAVR